MKKTLLILFIVFSSINTFSQIIERGYNARNLGSSLTEAQNVFCNGNPAVSGDNYELNVYTFDQSQVPLQENTLYETIDEDDNIRYIYVISERSNPFSDRDGFPAANVNIIEFTCPNGNGNQDNSNPNDIIEIGYIARNLGNDLNSAQFEYCSNANKSNAGQRYQLNVRSNQSDSRLEVGSFYRQTTEDNQVRYVYIVGFNTNVFSDRDLYDINEFIEQPLTFSCDYDGDGIDYVNDNCHDVYNPNQADFDQDGQGDACDNEDDRDFDNDGIRNHDDICPNEAGPVSNNGCPLGNPDLVVDLNNSTTIVPSSGNPTISLSSNILENLYLGDEIQVYLKVDNKGEVSSGSFKVGFYASVDNNISNSRLLLDESFPSIPANSSRARSISISHWHFANLLGILGNAYIHIKIDKDNNVIESNESNNSFSSRRINVLNRHRFSRPDYPKVILDLEDFSRITVNNKQEEEEALSQLKKGKLYLIKGKRDAQKILIEE